jgi:hypothetical protein
MTAMAKKTVAEVWVDALRPWECNESMGWRGTPSTAAPTLSVGGPRA